MPRPTPAPPADGAPAVPIALTKLPLPAGVLALQPGEPWPRRELKGARRIGRGAVVAPGIPAPDRIAVRRGRTGAVIDARTGDVIASLPAPPEHVSPRAGVLTLAGSPPRLVRLADHAVITPMLDAGERVLARAWLAASPAHDVPIALGETAAGEKLAGIAGPDRMRFRLTPTPLPASATQYAAVLNVVGGWQLTATRRDRDALGCDRVRVAGDGALRCLQPPRGSSAHPRWMAGGWVSDFDSLSHDSWQGHSIDFSQAVGLERQTCAHRASFDDPPRVLLTCVRGGPALLWSPGKLHTFRGPEDSNAAGGVVGASSRRVIPIFDGPRDPRPTQAARWVDLAGEKLWSAPPLEPLAIAAFAGVETRALAAERHGKSSDVWLLDFESGTRTRVATISDCPGELTEIGWEPGGGSRQLVLACMTPEAPHSVARALIWSEIVDTQTRVRWRTMLLPDAFFPSGMVVLSSRRVLAAESRSGEGALWSFDLSQR